MADASNITVTVEQETPSFIRKKGELDGLLKQLQKVSDDAVKVLVDQMNDPESDNRTKKACAERLLEFHIQVAKEVNADNMQRLIAEIKVKGGTQGKLVPVEPGRKVPTLDFNNIQEV